MVQWFVWVQLLTCLEQIHYRILDFVFCVMFKKTPTTRTNQSWIDIDSFGPTFVVLNVMRILTQILDSVCREWHSQS